MRPDRRSDVVDLLHALKRNNSRFPSAAVIGPRSDCSMQEGITDEAVVTAYLSRVPASRPRVIGGTHRIATNTFLSNTRRRRHLPSDPGPPAADVSLDAVLDQESA